MLTRGRVLARRHDSLSKIRRQDKRCAERPVSHIFPEIDMIVREDIGHCASSRASHVRCLDLDPAPRLRRQAKRGEPTTIQVTSTLGVRLLRSRGRRVRSRSWLHRLLLRSSRAPGLFGCFAHALRWHMALIGVRVLHRPLHSSVLRRSMKRPCDIEGGHGLA